MIGKLNQNRFKWALLAGTIAVALITGFALPGAIAFFSDAEVGVDDNFEAAILDIGYHTHLCNGYLQYLPLSPGETMRSCSNSFTNASSDPIIVKLDFNVNVSKLQESYFEEIEGDFYLQDGVDYVALQQAALENEDYSAYADAVNVTNQPDANLKMRPEFFESDSIKALLYDGQIKKYQPEGEPGVVYMYVAPEVESYSLGHFYMDMLPEAGNEYQASIFNFYSVSKATQYSSDAVDTMFGAGTAAMLNAQGFEIPAGA